jgi:MFS family permease
MGRLKELGRALAHRNYRLYVVGQGVSLIGTWMQQVGLSWMVYETTNSPLLLGLVSFSGQFPSVILAPIAGVYSDRWNRHRTLLVTQTAAMIQALLLVALLAFGQPHIAALVVLNLAAGIINAFDLPIRQAFLVDMITDRRDLPNAIAINSSIVNLTRLIGPFLAGIVIAAGGAMTCFLMNAISFVAVLIGLLMMKDLPPRKPSPTGTVTEGLIEGVRYAWMFRPIRALLMMMSLVSLCGMSQSTILPVFATKILGGGPMLFGMLAGASGCGALASAIYLASRKSVLGLGKKMSWATGIFGLGLIAFGNSRSIPLSIGLLTITGFTMMLQMAASNTILQTITDEDKRGRVLSLYAMAFMGSAPIGSLMAGAIAQRFGPAVAPQVAGSICLIGAAVFAWVYPSLREEVIPIYRRTGVLPQAVAIEEVAELTKPPETSA